MVGTVIYNVWLLAASVLVAFIGLGLVASALFGRPASRSFRDRAIVGLCLLGTAVVCFFFSQGGDALFSDTATSVSNAPGP